MARQVQKWESVDGGLHDTEEEADAYERRITFLDDAAVFASEHVQVPEGKDAASQVALSRVINVVVAYEEWLLERKSKEEA